MSDESQPIRGRGTSANPTNRFELISYERDEDCTIDDGPRPPTEVYRDTTRSIISYNDSPDVAFDASINPYRGCEHGCIYCYARPYHEYLGFSPGLDFETKIIAKHDAPELLRRELSSKRWKPQLLGLSGVTDCYQPVERKLQLTRRCLEVLAEFRNPVAAVTKNHLVTRDADLLCELHRYNASAVFISLTTLDGSLARIMEPRASQPEGRLAAMRELAAAGVPVGALIAPVIPGLTDHEIPQLLEAIRDAGGTYAGYVMLRLPHSVAELFETWLEQHFPAKKSKVMERIRELRQGKVNESDFGKRMRGGGIWATVVQQLFEKSCRKLGLNVKRPILSADSFRIPGELTLF